MKEKFLAVLKAEWSRLGLKKDALDRVASQRIKTIEKEEDIEAAVKDADTMSLLMTELQRSADAERDSRAQLQKDFDSYKTEHPAGDPKNLGGGEGNQDKGMTPEAVSELIKTAVAAAVQPIQDSFNAFKEANSAKEIATQAKATFFSNKWTERYKDEADDAWERVTELNEAKGGKMTAEELSKQATAYFNKSVQRQGVDATQPFPSETGGDGNFDFSDQVKMLQKEHLIPEEKKD